MCQLTPIYDVIIDQAQQFFVFSYVFCLFVGQKYKEIELNKIYNFN